MIKPRSPPASSRALEQRNALMVLCYQAGETLGNIAASLALSRERVRQIVRQSGADMPSDFKCAVEDCDISPRSPHIYCRAHRVRFERYDDPLGTPPARPLRQEQHGSYAAYTHGGCRCSLCRLANANWRREHRQQRRLDRATPDEARKP